MSAYSAFDNPIASNTTNIDGFLNMLVAVREAGDWYCGRLR